MTSFRSCFIRHYLWSILPPIEGLPDKPLSSRVSTKPTLKALPTLMMKKFHAIVSMAVDMQRVSSEIP